MIWFTSDWHLDHANIIKYSNRPFANVEEQQKVILSNFFIKVKKGDIVYFLGDIAFNSDAFQLFAKQFRQQYGTSVEFHYIEGNHEKSIIPEIKRFATSYSKLNEIYWNDQPITLCHYIMYSFSKSHFNAWQIYGHHHGYVDTKMLGKRMNVCVELNNYSPVSIDNVAKWMDQQPNNWDLLTKNKINGENALN